MEVAPLTDEEAIRIRTNLIETLTAKNSTLREQRDKIDAKIHLNRQIISQLREITPCPFQSQASDINSPRWKRLTRTLQAGVESQDPSKKSKTT